MPKLIPEQFGKILYETTNGLTGKEQSQAIAVFAELLKKHQMLSKLPYIIEAYAAYVRKVEGIVEPELITARPASKATVSAVADVYSSNGTVHTKENEELIGGLVVKADNKIMDASIKTQVRLLKQHLES